MWAVALAHALGDSQQLAASHPGEQLSGDPLVDGCPLLNAAPLCGLRVRSVSWIVIRNRPPPLVGGGSVVNTAVTMRVFAALVDYLA
jgi:hypothetical protein